MPLSADELRASLVRYSEIMRQLLELRRQVTAERDAALAALSGGRDVEVEAQRRAEAQRTAASTQLKLTRATHVSKESRLEAELEEERRRRAQHSAQPNTQPSAQQVSAATPMYDHLVHH